MLTAGKINLSQYVGYFGITVLVIGGFLFYETTPAGQKGKKAAKAAAEAFEREHMGKGGGAATNHAAEGVRVKSWGLSKITFTFYGVEFSFKTDHSYSRRVRHCRHFSVHRCRRRISVRAVLDLYCRLPMYIVAGTSALAVLISMITSIFTYMFVKGTLLTSLYRSRTSWYNHRVNPWTYNLQKDTRHLAEEDLCGAGPLCGHWLYHQGVLGHSILRACNRKHEIFERLITRWPNHSATFPPRVLMAPFYQYLDPYSSGSTVSRATPLRIFLLGTFVLALLSVIIGEFSISLIFRINRTFIDKQTDEIVRYQNLSIDALAAGDKEAYHASNKMANEAFGKSFFMQIAMSAAFLWPIFFVLTWMQSRFDDVEFRILFTDHSVGFICVFVALYAPAYLIFKRISTKFRIFDGSTPYWNPIGSVPLR